MDLMDLMELYINNHGTPWNRVVKMGKIELDGKESALLMALHSEGNTRTIRYWEWEPLGSLQRKGLICRASYS
jgi:hypothetical protein